MRLHKTKKWPKAPSDCDDINKIFEDEDLLKEFGYTKHDEHSTPFFRVAHKSTQFEYCVFASQRIIDLIQQHIPVDQRNISMDATFQIVPFGAFKQILILYVERYGTVRFFIHTHLVA